MKWRPINISKNRDHLTTGAATDVKTHEPNALTYSVMESSEKEEMHGPFTSIKELMKDLNA